MRVSLGFFITTITVIKCINMKPLFVSIVCGCCDHKFKLIFNVCNKIVYGEKCYVQCQCHILRKLAKKICPLLSDRLHSRMQKMFFFYLCPLFAGAVTTNSNWYLMYAIKSSTEKNAMFNANVTFCENWPRKYVLCFQIDFIQECKKCNTWIS